jgi:hypothetical protein
MLLLYYFLKVGKGTNIFIFLDSQNAFHVPLICNLKSLPSPLLYALSVHKHGTCNEFQKEELPSNQYTSFIPHIPSAFQRLSYQPRSKEGKDVVVLGVIYAVLWTMAFLRSIHRHERLVLVVSHFVLYSTSQIPYITYEQT